MDDFWSCHIILGLLIMTGLWSLIVLWPSRVTKANPPTHCHSLQVFPFKKWMLMAKTYTDLFLLLLGDFFLYSGIWRDGGYHGVGTYRGVGTESPHWGWWFTETGPFVSCLFSLDVEAVGGEGTTRWQQALSVLKVLSIFWCLGKESHSDLSIHFLCWSKCLSNPRAHRS